LKVQGDDTLFALERGAEDVQVLSFKAAAYTHNHAALFNQNAVDSAGHDRVACCRMPQWQTERQP
jgi:hypothetical protein